MERSFFCFSFSCLIVPCVTSNHIISIQPDENILDNRDTWRKLLQLEQHHLTSSPFHLIQVYTSQGLVLNSIYFLASLLQDYLPVQPPPQILLATPNHHI